MPWIEQDRRRLYCFDAGEGRPVALLHGMAHVVDVVAGFNGDNLLGSIRARTLFIGGSGDPSARSAGASWQGGRRRSCRIAGARHTANVDEAEAFTERLLRFLT